MLFPSTLLAITSLNESLATFAFSKPEGFTFKPGQFLTFSLQVAAAAEGVKAEERAITRCYSLSDRPDPARYRITIKRVPAPAGRPDLPPGASSTYFHDKVHVRDVLKVRAPPVISSSTQTHTSQHCRRHRHHADDEYAALVPCRAAGENCAPLLWASA